MDELNQAVIDLHDIARKIEQIYECEGKLSVDIRQCADRLSVVLKPTKHTSTLTKGD